MIQHIFELLPVGLALVAAVMCAAKFKLAKDTTDRVVLGIGVACACLLIVAQTSWWGSNLLLGDLEGTVWANHVWTVFNSLVMVGFIAFARGRRCTG